MTRHERRDFELGEPTQMLGERIDRADERLVRHRLALEATTGEDERAGRADLLGKLANQRRLANAGASLDEHRHRACAVDVGERAVQLRELFGAPDKPTAERDHRRSTVARRIWLAEPALHRATG